MYIMFAMKLKCRQFGLELDYGVTVVWCIVKRREME